MIIRDRKGTSLLLVFGLFFLATFTFIFAETGHAHKVQIFAYPEGDTIFVEGYFADGKKPKNSRVTVYGAEGEELFHGVTDDEGKLSFKIPRKTDLRITLDAGMGHKAEYTLPAGELNGAAKKGAVDNPSSLRVARRGDKTVTVDRVVPPEKGRSGLVNQLDEARIQAIVEQAVDRSVGEAIKPLVRSFNDMTQKNSLTTIIGGIGYILGLMGVALYFKSRRGP